MAKLFRRLAVSYTAGIDILTVFRNECNTGSPKHRAKMNEIVAHLKNGESVVQAMQSADYFPELTLSVVEAGEAGGKMEESFRRLAEHYDGLVKFRNSFLLSISWPVFELVAGIVIIGLLILGLGWVASYNKTEPIITLGTGSATGAFILYCSVVLIFFGMLGVLFLGFKNGWFGNYPMEIARRIPLVGPTIEAMALSRFAWTMSVAENAGMSALKTIDLAVKSTQNHYYEKQNQQLCNAIQQGRDFTQSMSQARVFPAEFLSFVQTGETSGELAETMDRASTALQHRAENNMKIIGKIGLVLVMMLVGLIMAFAIITMFMKLYMEPYQQLIDEVTWLASQTLVWMVGDGQILR